MRFQVVSFHCVLSSQLGSIISTSFNQEVVTNGPDDGSQILPAFAKALESMKPGQRKKIFLTAEEAYGYYDPSLMVEEKRSNLRNGKNLKIGDKVKGSVPSTNAPRNFRVVEANPMTVTLDGNHPLAGQDLIFDVEITSSRIEEEHPPAPQADTWVN